VGHILRGGDDRTTADQSDSGTPPIFPLIGEGSGSLFGAPTKAGGPTKTGKRRRSGPYREGRYRGGVVVVGEGRGVGGRGIGGRVELGGYTAIDRAEGLSPL
jgi:hypothetical protein